MPMTSGHSEPVSAPARTPASSAVHMAASGITLRCRSPLAMTCLSARSNRTLRNRPAKPLPAPVFANVAEPPLIVRSNVTLLESKRKGRLCAFSCSVSLSPSRLHFCSAVPAIRPRRLELRKRTSTRDGYMTCSASQQPQSDATSMPRPVRPTSLANMFPSRTQGTRSRSSRTTSLFTALVTPTIQSGLHAGGRRSSGVPVSGSGDRQLAWGQRSSMSPEDFLTS